MTSPIQRPPEVATELVHRFASTQVPISSQLVVGPDECVVVARDGVVLGVVPPGSHWLHPQALPFVAAAVVGGNLVAAELWFVRTGAFHGIQFGGALGAVVDPATQVECSPRAFGDFGLTVSDPARVVTACLSGAAGDAGAMLGWVKQLVMKKLAGAFTVAVAGGKSVTAPDLVMILQDQVAGDLGELAPIGLAFARFGNVTVSFAEEDVAAMRKVATERAMAKRAAAAAPPEAACPRCAAPVGGGRFCGQCGAALA